MRARKLPLTFEDFIDPAAAQWPRVAWVKQPSGLQIYVRRAIMVQGGFELANVTLPTRKQKKGIFSAFLAQYETKLPLLLENVLTDHLEAHMRRRAGWSVKPSSESYSLTFINSLWRESLEQSGRQR
jgi:hypothetical protein